MKTVTTEHPLRTIVLVYDETKTETDYEKQLVKSYLALHDRLFELNKFREKMLFQFQQLEDQTEAAEKEFEPIAQQLSAFLADAELVAKKMKDAESVEMLADNMTAYNNDVISVFHQQTLVPLADFCTTVCEEFDAYVNECEELYEYFDEHSNELTTELYKNYEQYSLQMVEYSDDEEIFNELISEIEIDKEQARVVDRHNLLQQTVGEKYELWTKAQEAIAQFYDTDNLLDNSLSLQTASGSLPAEKRPLYLIPPDDKRVKNFGPAYSPLASNQNKTLTIAVPVEIVHQEDVAMLQEIVMCMQHYPGLIEKWIFAIDIQFQNEYGADMTEDDWKGHHKPMRWFLRLNSLPCIIFFIQDHDARHYMLMGDIVADGKVKIIDDGAVLLDGEIMQQVQERLFTACWFFMLYCHNTGFDPEPYIEALMSDFNAAFTYEDVKEKYQEDIANGVELKAVSFKHDKK